MSDKYDKNGKPLTLMEWAELMEDLEYKRIGLDVANGLRVSTVWLGLDHSFGSGPPLIFETMVFGTDEEYTERYSTLEQAIAGHKRIVGKFRKEKHET